MTAVAVRSNELAEVAQQIINAKASLAAAANFVTTASADEVKETLDKVRLAREWAKIHKAIKNLQTDLLRADIMCLRRIGQLRATEVLHANSRAAAEFYADQTDAQIDALILDFSASSTGTAVFRAMQKKQMAEGERERGREFASQFGSNIADERETESSFRYRWSDTRGALVRILEDYAGHNFTIAEMADDLMSDIGYKSDSTDISADVRQGVSEVCRRAVLSAPPLTIGDLRLPRFITAYDEISEAYLRIPFENATPRQFAQMIKLRRRQLAEDQAAFDRLVAAYEAVSEKADPDKPMGKPSRLPSRRDERLEAA